jgi:hypothetical protein
MQQHECDNQLFIHINNFLEFISFVKIKVLHDTDATFGHQTMICGTIVVHSRHRQV